MARSGVWGAAVGLAACSFVQAAEVPADWLLRVSEAARTSNYSGVLVYQGDEVLETFRVTHRYDAATGERERVQSLTGEVREILKRDDKLISVMPKYRQVTAVRGLFPGFTRERVQQLAALYDFEDLGAARVAGRSCRGIAVAPRDALRYGYEVWADAATAVPLRVSVLGAGQRRIEQMFFTEVEFPASIPDSAFETELDTERRRRVTEAAAGAITAATQSQPAETASAEPAPKGGGLQIGELPAGFRVLTRDSQVLPGDRGVVEHVLISDGLAAISIFRSQLRVPGPPPDGQATVSQMGAMQAYGRIIGRTRVTVVGEAPSETLRMIADNLKAPAADAAPGR